MVARFFLLKKEKKVIESLVNSFRDLEIREIQVRPVIEVPFPMGTV